VCIRLCLARLDDWQRNRSALWISLAGGGTDIREGLSTIRLFAMVRLLAGMGANVHRQRAPLDEALPATLLVASVRSLLGVYAMMSLQIRFAIEALRLNQPTAHCLRYGYGARLDMARRSEERESGGAYLLAFRPRAGERPGRLAVGGRLTVVDDFENIHQSSRVVGESRTGTCASILQTSRGGTNRQ